MVSKELKGALTVLIVTHVTHVKRVESGVCGSYINCIQSNATHVESVLCVQWPLAPGRREGFCMSLSSWEFSCSPLVSLRRQLC